MAVPACCRTARARGAVPTGRQSGRSTSANDPPAHVHRARSCRTAHPVRLAVVPSSTQFLPLNRTESVSFHHFNQRVFQQNRPRTDIARCPPFGRYEGKTDILRMLRKDRLSPGLLLLDEPAEGGWAS